jgi:hypothetical protein
MAVSTKDMLIAGFVSLLALAATAYNAEAPAPMAENPKRQAATSPASGKMRLAQLIITRAEIKISHLR